MSSSVELVKLSSLSQNSKSKSNLNLSPTGCPKQNWGFKFLLDIGHPKDKGSPDPFIRNKTKALIGLNLKF